MKRLIFAAVTLCLIATGANSYWQSRTQSSIAVAASYQGPGDVVSFTWWGGFRAYSAATAGTKAVRIVRASDSTETDINTLANGTFDAASATSFCASTTCKVVTVYDKVGTNDATQANNVTRPALTSNALGTSYCMSFTSASGNILQTASTYTQSQPFELLAIAKQTLAPDGGIISVDSGFSGALLNVTAASNLQVYAGTGLLLAETINTFHAFQGLFAGGSSVANVDGAETTGNAGAQGTSAVLTLGASGTGSQFSDHVICEGGFIAGTVSAPNRGSLNTNMHSAYGSW